MSTWDHPAPVLMAQKEVWSIPAVPKWNCYLEFIVQ
jgi:hypothetical protein